jgi:predicted signal transduction protein with EAL and GGDEF domain
LVNDSTAYFRKTGLIGRISKDEFVIYDKVGIYGEELLNFATNAQATLQVPIFIDSKSIYLEVKCGVACEVVSNTSDLLRHAQIASFYALERNIDKPILFDITFEILVAKNEVILGEIRRSIEQGSFSLFLQPIVDLSTEGTPEGGSTFIRMQDSNGSFIPPDVFILLAERHGLINEITQWVIKNACQQLNFLRNNYHPDFEISINISPSRFETSYKFFRVN